ncbi:MAG TPA: pirin family protein [Jatrophihabitans sp.]|nr:pirin family protein [Jatrophihabitans sp.]
MSGEERGRSSGPGIESWHSFSSGPYYDPSRISFGPVIGVDEHLVAPGAGFDWHAHRGVHIASWVLSGALRHEDSAGAVRVVRPGELFVQSTGTGMRHREWNASADEPLRFVQITVLGDGEPGRAVRSLPAEVAGVRVAVEPEPDPSAFCLELPSGYLVLSL